MFNKQKAKLTKHGFSTFGTKQKFFNRLVCPSTVLIWSCQHMVRKDHMVNELEDGVDVEMTWGQRHRQRLGHCVTNGGVA